MLCVFQAEIDVWQAIHAEIDVWQAIHADVETHIYAWKTREDKKITRDILESYLYRMYKGYLKLNGE